MTGDSLEVDSSDFDIEDSMAETLKEIQAGDSDIEEEVSDVEVEVEEEVVTEKSARARGADGKFIKTEAAEETVEVEPVDEIVPDAVLAENESIAPEVAEPVVPEQIDHSLAIAPSTWRAAAKEKWNTIDPGIREEILKREVDIGRGINQYKQDADYGRGVQQTLTPYMAMINASGSTPNQVVSSMLDTFYRLTNSNPQEKAQVLLQAAQQYGADMSILQQEVDPQQNQMQQQLYPVMQEVQQLKQQLSQRDNQAQQQEFSQATSSIEAFRNATDEAGQLKHPHLESVRDNMASQIERANSMGNEMTLDEAYENAIWAQPELRQSLQAAQSVTSEATRIKEAAEKAKKAKKAAGVNVKSEGSYDEVAPRQTGSVTDTLAETLKDIQTR